MKITKNFPVLIIILLSFACNRGFNSKAKPGEGTITYSISYPDSMKYGIKAALLPKIITLFFKGDKATFVASAGLGTIQIVDLIDGDNRKFTSLFIDEIHGNVGCIRTAKEIALNESSPILEFQPLHETKIIQGLECRKAIVKDITHSNSFEIYFYDKIKFKYMSSPFVNLQPNLMMEYSHTVNNLTMKLKAIKVDLTTPVDTSMFQIKGTYRWLNEKDYYSHLNSL